MCALSNIKPLFQLRLYLKQLERFDYDSLYLGLKLQGGSADYLLESKQFNRGRQYVKSFGLMGLSYQKLIERKLNESELKRIILLSHLAPIYDDLFDKVNTPKERIIELLKEPQQAGKNNEETLFLIFYRPMFSELIQKEEFLKYFLLLTEAQEQSKKQLTGKLTKNEVVQVTEQKGGYSALLLYSLLDSEHDYKDQLYQLGACSQYMDDIFDWYEDCIEGRNTIANQYELKELQKFFSDYKSKTVDSFNDPFKALVSVLMSPGNICLDYYETKGVRTKEKPTQRVICDMESPLNILKLIFS